MRKHLATIVFKITFAISIILLSAIVCLCVIMLHNNLFIYIAGIYSTEIIILLAYFLFLSIFISLFLYGFIKKDAEMLLLFLSFIAIGSVLFYAGFLSYISSDSNIKISSPSKTHQILIKESAASSFSNKGDINLYEILSPHIVKNIGNYTYIDSGYKPISEGAFTIIWNKENMVLTYCYGKVEGYVSKTISYDNLTEDEKSSPNNIISKKKINMESKMKTYISARTKSEDDIISKDTDNDDLSNVKNTPTGLERGVIRFSDYIIKDTIDKDKNSLFLY